MIMCSTAKSTKAIVSFEEDPCISICENDDDDDDDDYDDDDDDDAMMMHYNALE